MPADALETYLNDHLAGAMLGSDLAARIAERNEGEPLGEVMERLAAEIEEDRELLITLMERVGATRNPAKQATTWVAEQASRLKLSGITAGGDTELGTFLALESMVLGVTGKRALWLALIEVAGDHPGLAGVDLGELADRAAQQRDTLERERIAAAHRALAA